MANRGVGRHARDAAAEVTRTRDSSGWTVSGANAGRYSVTYSAASAPRAGADYWRGGLRLKVTVTVMITGTGTPFRSVGSYRQPFTASTAA